MLEDAARVGLLTGLGAGMYRIHPALPGYLAAGWHTDGPARYSQERDACEQALCTACAEFSQWLTVQIQSGDAALAYAVLGWQRRTLGAMLGHALDQHAWDHACAIVRALDDYWNTRGLGEEAVAWADRILDAITNGHQRPPESAQSLWLYTTFEQATRQKDAGQPEQASRTYRQILAYLQDQPETEWTRSNISATYHQLGYTAQDRGQLAEAEDWYRQALAISEELGDRPGLALIYHQLGITAQDRGQLAEAEDWYRQALAIKEELGDRPGLARTYHQLGTTAQARGQLAEAEDWYRQSLAISEELGNRPNMAVTYHQLGITAQDRGQLAEAEDWYRQSLAISEELGNRPGMALTYGQLGLLAEPQQQPRQALDWTVRCVSLFGQFPHPATGPGPDHLARLTKLLGMTTLEQSWRQVTGQPIPQAVRDHLISQHSNEDDPGGTP